MISVCRMLRRVVYMKYPDWLEISMCFVCKMRYFFLHLVRSLFCCWAAHENGMRCACDRMHDVKPVPFPQITWVRPWAQHTLSRARSHTHSIYTTKIQNTKIEKWHRIERISWLRCALPPSWSFVTLIFQYDACFSRRNRKFQQNNYKMQTQFCV